MTQDQFVEDLEFFTPKENDPLQSLTDSQKAVLAEQADQKEQSIFEIMDDIKRLADEIINY